MRVRNRCFPTLRTFPVAWLVVICCLTSFIFSSPIETAPCIMSFLASDLDEVSSNEKINWTTSMTPFVMASFGITAGGASTGVCRLLNVSMK